MNWLYRSWFDWDAKQRTVKQSINFQKQKVLLLLSWRDKRKSQCSQSPEASHWEKLALLYAWPATVEDTAMLRTPPGTEWEGQILWLFSSPSNFPPVPPITWTWEKVQVMGKSQLTQELGNCRLQKLKVIIWSSSREGYRVKLIYFGHPLQRTDSLEKNLILGKTEDRRRRRWQRMR